MTATTVSVFGLVRIPPQELWSADRTGASVVTDGRVLVSPRLGTRKLAPAPRSIDALHAGPVLRVPHGAIH